ncbi:hypothetical protein [Halorubrum ezzemoulense]|uniref:hypothetical protein n=1 Tax=Halorubrum ezzemoulense TaxID=337243 RepID=UPI00232C9E67|nr:hypothetical protein [Halorubrum ezzemoulense]MDB9235350.1 hypothetical protein [Halorubrum ezzemoulense]
MTASQPDSEGYTRRGVMRKAAVGLGATAAVGSGASRMGVSPVGTAAAVPPIVIGGVGGIAAAKAADYLIKNVNSPFTGSSNEDYTDANADAVHQQIRENALSARQSDIAVFGTFENLLNSSSNYVIAEAKKAAIDVLNTDGQTQDAVNAAKAEVDKFYSTQEKNLIAHFEAQYSKLNNWVAQADNTEGLSSGDVFSQDSNSNKIVSINSSQSSYQLVNGNSYEYTEYKAQNSNSITVLTNNPNPSDPDKFTSVLPVDGGEVKKVFDNSDQSLFEDIQTQHSNIASEMETWVNGVAGSYKSGDINTSDLISPSDLTGDSQTQDGYSFAGASLASMGIKSSDFALEIELVESGEVVEGSIYHNDDSISSLQKDVKYDPETDISGTVYIAYNVTDSSSGDTNTTDTNTTLEDSTTTEGGGSLVALNQPFIIRSITDGEGNTYNAANYESKNQQTFDTEIEEVQKELEQVRELRESLEEQRDAAAMNDGGGAGGGFFSGSGSPDVGLIATVVGGAGVVYALFGQGGNS